MGQCAYSGATKPGQKADNPCGSVGFRDMCVMDSTCTTVYRGQAIRVDRLEFDICALFMIHLYFQEEACEGMRVIRYQPNNMY